LPINKMGDYISYQKLRALLGAGYMVDVQGIYGKIPDKYTLSDTFNGAHAFPTDAYSSSRNAYYVVDTLFHVPARPGEPDPYVGQWLPSSALHAYAYALAGTGKIYAMWGKPAAPPPPEEIVRNFTQVLGSDGQLIVGTVMVKSPDGVTTPHSYLRLSDGKLIKATGIVGDIKQAQKVRLTEPITPGTYPGVDRQTGWLIGDAAAFLLETDATYTPYPSGTEFNDGVEAASQAALTAKK
jgi:hypothetical protein